MSWTESIKSVALIPFTKVVVTAKAYDKHWKFYPFGSLGLDAPPSLFINDEDEAQAYNRLIAAHDAYMAASCDSYQDYVGDYDGMKLSYLLGAFDVRLAGAKGVKENLIIPLLISPEVECTSLKGKHNVLASRSCRGLCFRGGVVVTAGGNADEFHRTLRHEFIHMLKMCIPHLSDEMYGGNPEAVTEEVMTHIVSDHIDKICSLDKLTVHGEVIKLKEKPYKCEGWTHEATAFNFTGVSFNGKPVPMNVIDIASDPDIATNREQIVSYYLKDLRRCIDTGYRAIKSSELNHLLEGAKAFKLSKCGGNCNNGENHKKER